MHVSNCIQNSTQKQGLVETFRGLERPCWIGRIPRVIIHCSFCIFEDTLLKYSLFSFSMLLTSSVGRISNSFQSPFFFHLTPVKRASCSRQTLRLACTSPQHAMRTTTHDTPRGMQPAPSIQPAFFVTEGGQTTPTCAPLPAQASTMHPALRDRRALVAAGALHAPTSHIGRLSIGLGERSALKPRPHSTC